MSGEETEAQFLRDVVDDVLSSHIRHPHVRGLAVDDVMAAITERNYYRLAPVGAVVLSATDADAQRLAKALMTGPPGTEFKVACRQALEHLAAAGDQS